MHTIRQARKKRDNLKVGVAVSISKVQLRLGAIQNVYSLHEFAGNINLSLVQIGPNQNHNVLRFHFYSSFLFVRFCVPHLFCDFSIAFSKSVSVVIMVHTSEVKRKSTVKNQPCFPSKNGS